MKYMLLIHMDEATMSGAREADPAAISAPYLAYTQAMVDAGILVAGDRLRPVATATTLRVIDGKTTLLDGPYAETKEQLGGYYIVDVPDLDAALSWAARCPGARSGAIEVRPIWAP